MIALLTLIASAVTPQDGRTIDGFYIESRITAIAIGPNRSVYFGTDSGLVGRIEFPSKFYSDWHNPLSVAYLKQLGGYVSFVAVSPDGEYFTAGQGNFDSGATVYLFYNGMISAVFTSESESGAAVFSPDSKAVFLPAHSSFSGEGPMTYRKWSTEFGTSTVRELREPDEQLRKAGVGAFGKLGGTYLEVSGPLRDGTYSIRELGWTSFANARVFGSWPKETPLAGIQGGLRHSWSGTRVAMRSRDRKRIDVYSILDGSIVVSIEHPTDIWYEQFSLAGEKLLFAATIRGEEVWNVETGQHLMTIRIVSDGIGASLFALLPDGRYSVEEPYLKRPMLSASMVFQGFPGELRQDVDAIGNAALDIWQLLVPGPVHRRFCLPWEPSPK
ncbi:MAG: WD40 repeat domain-containing protein [Armatimonadetes bacterium]|nr:WD40 repeat domain-containing protein [Armatimonadota bacterium]